GGRSAPLACAARQPGDRRRRAAGRFPGDGGGDWQFQPAPAAAAGARRHGRPRARWRQPSEDRPLRRGHAMTAVTAGIPDSRTPRWLMPVLVGSLALNMIVIGAAGSLIWRGQPDAPFGRRVVANIIGYAATLPAERRAELERQIKDERQKAWPLRRALIA